MVRGMRAILWKLSLLALTILCYGSGAVTALTQSAPEEILPVGQPLPGLSFADPMCLFWPLTDGIRREPNLPLGPVSAAAEADELLVFLTSGTDVLRFCHDYGLNPLYSLQSDPDAWVLRASDPQQADSVLGRLWQSLRRRSALPENPDPKEPRVRAAYRNVRLPHDLDEFFPDDPLFFRSQTGSDLSGHASGQWYLSNPFLPGLDAGVSGAWANGLTGAGVIVGLVDDGLETSHPDLAPNYRPADSWDFGQRDPDPNPFYNGTGTPYSPQDRHGVGVAGIAAARGGNGIGGTGAAPYAGLAGLRADFTGAGTTAMFVDATLYHSSDGIRTIAIKNHSYGYARPYVNVPAERDALETSAAAGTIHTVSAGNSRGAFGEDTSRRMLNACPGAITVAALNSVGTFSYYSNFGANVMVCAPSSGSVGMLPVISTDRTGSFGYNGFADGEENYTPLFGGTSSAAPLVAGALALVRQAQPALNTRFAKHLLVRTSKMVDPDDHTAASDGGWKTNAAGFRFNQNYGFGLIDAAACAQRAVQCLGVTPLQVENVPVTVVAASIPDNNGAGITRTFRLQQDTPLEEILVSLNITHPHRGDIEAYLTSPSGLTTRLTRRSSDMDQNIAWTFCANAFWGESPQGEWRLNVRDIQTQQQGVWNAFAVTARMGTLIPRTISGQITLEGTTDAAQPLTFTFRAQAGGETFSRMVQLNPLQQGGSTGTFALSYLPSGTYDIAIKGEKWLQTLLREVRIADHSVTGLSAILPAGDVNGDNFVDALDLGDFILAFNATPASLAWNPYADLNGDQSVDALDLALLVLNFNREGDN